MRKAPTVRLLRGERARLEAVARSAASPPRLARRARLVLRAAQGRTNREIATELATDPGTVARWRRRFLMQRVPGILRDAPRTGRPPSIPASKIRVVVRSTLGRRAPGGRYWSARSLAREVGLSKSTIQRIWKAHGLEPRRPSETFRADPGMGFVQGVTDFVGLYLDAPERAMAFAVDRRARPARSAPSARSESTRDDDRRRCLAFRAFLQSVDRETPRRLEVHLLVDSRVTPADPDVHLWLARHPRFFLHTVPTGGPGANVIGRWFAEFTRRRVGRQASASVLRLHRAVRDHLAHADRGGPPFVWTATAEEIQDRSRPRDRAEPRPDALGVR